MLFFWSFSPLVVLSSTPFSLRKHLLIFFRSRKRQCHKSLLFHSLLLCSLNHRIFAYCLSPFWCFLLWETNSHCQTLNVVNFNRAGHCPFLPFGSLFCVPCQEAFRERDCFTYTSWKCPRIESFHAGLDFRSLIQHVELYPAWGLFSCFSFLCAVSLLRIFAVLQ